MKVLSLPTISQKARADVIISVTEMEKATSQRK